MSDHPDAVSVFEYALASIVGTNVPRPKGTLAGHAAGLPFEVEVQTRLAEALEDAVLRHSDLLNEVLRQSPAALTIEQRIDLLGTPATRRLLSRGRQAMGSWSDTSGFEEKQNDIFESVVVREPIAANIARGAFVGIDIKTTNTQKKGQPPNIISADKVARMAVLVLEGETEPEFDILYIGIDWIPTQSTLECKSVRVVSLFKILPNNIYINWVAAQQVQFHLDTVDQDYTGSRLHWCRDYLEKFCESLGNRIHKEERRLEEFQAALDGFARKVES